MLRRFPNFQNAFLTSLTYLLCYLSPNGYRPDLLSLCGIAKLTCVDLLLSRAHMPPFPAFFLPPLHLFTYPPHKRHCRRPPHPLRRCCPPATCRLPCPSAAGHRRSVFPHLSHLPSPHLSSAPFSLQPTMQQGKAGRGESGE